MEETQKVNVKYVIRYITYEFGNNLKFTLGHSLASYLFRLKLKFQFETPSIADFD